MEVIESPLVKNGKANQVRLISTRELRANYLNSLDIKVLQGESLEYIREYRCERSGYFFFYPFNIAGESSFYEQLEKFEWYYMPWKWEHEVTCSFVSPGDRVLEIGCAKGDFLAHIKDKFRSEVFGLELNESALRILKNREIQHSSMSIQEFSRDNSERFDLVCAFQVLEHISDVYSFLESSVDVLKKGGKLVISVPNNDSFIRFDDGPLNLPPHHMGRWNRHSLEHIANIFDLKVNAVRFEPLQKYHVKWYYQLMSARLLPPFVNKILEKTKINHLLMRLIESIRHRIKGHSILIVLDK